MLMHSLAESPGIAFLPPEESLRAPLDSGSNAPFAQKRFLSVFLLSRLSQAMDFLIQTQTLIRVSYGSKNLGSNLNISFYKLYTIFPKYETQVRYPII